MGANAKLSASERYPFVALNPSMVEVVHAAAAWQRRAMTRTTVFVALGAGSLGALLQRDDIDRALPERRVQELRRLGEHEVGRLSFRVRAQLRRDEARNLHVRGGCEGGGRPRS